MSGTIDDLFKLPFIGIGYLFTKIMNVLAKIATLGIAGSETNAPSEAMSKKMIEILEKLLGAKIYFTVGPKEHTDGNSFYSNLESKREILFDDSQGSENKKTVARKYKQWFKEQPHLWDHTTFQFYLFNNITMMANAQFLGIEYNKEKDQFELPYKLFINHAPGVLVYRWEFLYINVKCEVKVMGSFQNNFNLLNVITSISVLGCGIGLNTQGANLDPKNMRNELGADENAQQEEQGERTFKSTLFDALNKTIEPSQFFSNTIDFHYSLGEFFCRLTDPIWFYRIELSQLLYNNLQWANNKCKILHLPLQWNDLVSWTQGRLLPDGKDTRKLGYWKWQGIHLQDDYDGFFATIMNKGYWLDGGEKVENPKLDYEWQTGYRELGGNSWDTYEAEEEYIEKEITETVEVPKTDHADSFDNITQYDNRVLFTTPPYLKDSSGNDVLLGLLQQTPNWNGGSGYSGWNYGGGWERTFTIPAGTYKYFWKVWTGPEKSGGLDSKEPIKVKISMRSGGGKGVGDGTVDIDFEWTQTETITKIIRESVFKEKKSTTQEIDEDKLEQDNEVEGEIEHNEVENEEEIEKEDEAESGEGSQQERDKEREREREQEPEDEPEKEKEQEGEKEDEREDETEKEGEKEPEKEKEKEKEPEKEQESEEESESEGESEEENEGEN